MRLARFTSAFFALAAAALVGCGDSGGGAPDPVGPGPAVPASLSITAGHQQQADAGSAVAVAPTVVVRDADGGVVSGVRVTFEVTAGGGTITGGTPQTSSTGLAAVERWTLGPDGPQRLRATVSGLAPVEFEATITPGTEVLEHTVGAGGGVIAITRSGHPFEGLELTVPSGAFTGTAAFRFRARPAPEGLVLPAGYVVRGPVLEVQTNAGRSDGLMTLEVPVSTGAGERVVLAFRDPVRGTLEVLPTVAHSATSVTVVTSHLSADLLLGAPTASAAASTAVGGPRRQGTPSGPTGELLAIVQEWPIGLVRVPLNAWPVLDHGSAAHPDGHGVAIPALQAVAPSVLTAPLSEIVRTLSVPGFYAEAGPLAALGILHQGLSAHAGWSAAAVSAATAGLSRDERDELVTRNVTAALALTGRPVPLAARVAGTPFSFLSAVGGGDHLLQVRPSTSVTELHVVRTDGSGLATIRFPSVVGGARVTADEVVPLPSFLVPWEQASEVVADLGRLAAAGSGDARDAINRGLAQRAGLPEPTIAASVLGGPFAEVSGPLVVRTPATQVRISGGRFGAFTLHQPSGDEVGRGDEQTAIGVAEAVAGVESGESVERIAALFEVVGGVAKQAHAVRLPLLHAPFAITPDSVHANGAPYVAEFAASVPAPPEDGFRIVWDWGDGESSDLSGLLTATHEFDGVGFYRVVATLQSADGSRDLARDSARVWVGDERWVGEVTYVSQLLDGRWMQTVTVRNLTFDFSSTVDDDARTYFAAAGDAQGRILMESGSGCEYDSGLIARPLMPAAGDYGLIYTRREDGRLLYQAEGGFGAPLVIPVDDHCDSRTVVEYPVYLWFRTDDGADGGLAWIEAPDPDRLEGSYTSVTGPVQHTWSWRFERVRSDPR